MKQNEQLIAEQGLRHGSMRDGGGSCGTEIARRRGRLNAALQSPTVALPHPTQAGEQVPPSAAAVKVEQPAAPMGGDWPVLLSGNGVCLRMRCLQP